MKPENLLGMMADCGKIVSYDQNCYLPFPAGVGNKFQHRMCCFGVHARSRFVEHQDVRASGQGAGDKHALFLTTGEFGKPFVSEIIGARRAQTFTREGAFGGRDKAPGAHASIRAHKSDVKPGQQINRIELTCLGNITEYERCTR
ncbi:hypothetical protein SBDP1_1030002 [Syntrophobacter sp. SbD1]|nr:hypothetical protein SBDP1_1030002 [Syntrophobacter sp. SbD1]